MSLLGFGVCFWQSIFIKCFTFKMPVSDREHAATKKQPCISFREYCTFGPVEVSDPIFCSAPRWVLCCYLNRINVLIMHQFCIIRYYLNFAAFAIDVLWASLLYVPCDHVWWRYCQNVEYVNRLWVFTCCFKESGSFCIKLCTMSCHFKFM